jgi:hypothetical protein
MKGAFLSLLNGGLKMALIKTPIIRNPLLKCREGYLLMRAAAEYGFLLMGGMARYMVSSNASPPNDIDLFTGNMGDWSRMSRYMNQNFLKIREISGMGEWVCPKLGSIQLHCSIHGDIEYQFSRVDFTIAQVCAYRGEGYVSKGFIEDQAKEILTFNKPETNYPKQGRIDKFLALGYTMNPKNDLRFISNDAPWFSPPRCNDFVGRVANAEALEEELYRRLRVAPGISVTPPVAQEPQPIMATVAWASVPPEPQRVENYIGWTTTATSSTNVTSGTYTYTIPPPPRRRTTS